MAKYIGLLTSDARGKLGGVVLTRARNGTNLKAKGVPNNTATPLQSLQRQRLCSALNAFRSLTDDEATSWGSVAANLTWSNSLAQTFVPTGLQLWTQAYINAAYFGTVPPGTCASSPSTVVPITALGLYGSQYDYLALASPASGPYTGSWLLFMSRVIPPSINYTKTIARRFIGAAPAGNEIFISAALLTAFGVAPPLFTYSAVRVVPIHPTYFFSGTSFSAITQFQP